MLLLKQSILFVSNAENTEIAKYMHIKLWCVLYMWKIYTDGLEWKFWLDVNINGWYWKGQDTRIFCLSEFKFWIFQDKFVDLQRCPIVFSALLCMCG